VKDNMPVTPIENRYPWLAIGDEKPWLPENPTERDFAKAYATMLMVYQAQRKHIEHVMEEYRDERKEILVVLKAISRHQTLAVPMPFWGKAHSVAIAIQTGAIVWLLLLGHRIVQTLASMHLSP
jgi:hypothetical protein